MTDIGSVPNRPLGTDARSISAMLANFDFITSFLDGDGWLSFEKLGDLAVTTAKINDLAVTTGKLADNAVTLAKMADNSVGTAELVNDSVTYAKLATDVENAFLKLFTAGDRKLKFGMEFPGGGAFAFGGGSRASGVIAHGLGGVPVWAMVAGGYVAGANTSTAVDEAVVASIKSMDGTNLAVQCFLTGGATAAVGPNQIAWAAIL